MTLGSDLVAKARSAASRRNRKIGVPKPYQTPVDESSSHVYVIEEETRGRSSSPPIEKDASDDENLNSGDTIFDYYTYSKVDRASFFERYSEEKVRVPAEVLYFSSSLTNLAVEKKARSLG